MTTLYQHPRFSHVFLFHCFWILFQKDIAVRTISCLKITFYHICQNNRMMLYFSSDYIISLIQNLIVYFFFFLSCIFFTPFNKNLKHNPWNTWVKISKVMPLPRSISPPPPGKGGKPYGKKSKSFG